MSKAGEIIWIDVGQIHLKGRLSLMSMSGGGKKQILIVILVIFKPNLHQHIRNKSGSYGATHKLQTLVACDGEISHYVGWRVNTRWQHLL